jgi:hypothetical protein
LLHADNQEPDDALSKSYVPCRPSGGLVTLVTQKSILHFSLFGRDPFFFSKKLSGGKVSRNVFDLHRIFLLDIIQPVENWIYPLGFPLESFFSS